MIIYILIRVDWMICENCGTENDDKNKFCKKCGKKLNNNNKIIIATICCLIVICGIIINLDNPNSNSSQENNYLNNTLENNTLNNNDLGESINFVVGYDDEFGNYEGFDLDLAQEVCARNGWTFTAQPIDWDAKDEELDSGSIDCIWNGFAITEDRKDQYTWSNPYFDNKQIFVVKANSNINKIDDLAGKTVETQKDSSALEALKGDNKTIADKFGTLTEVADYNTGFMDLESGACDAVATDIGVAEYDIKNKANSEDFKILEEAITTEQYGIAFKKGNDELKNKVQTTLDEMFKDGTVEKIAKKYGISNDTLINPE